MSNFDMQIKLLMIGDSGVGKTCLLVRFANDSYAPNGLNTIGIDFKIKNIIVEKKKIKLQIWDTAGQERFRTITTSYFRGAQGIVMVYDVTDRMTFASIRSWVAQIQQHADASVCTVLIGNKCDSNAREVSTAEGEQLAQEYGTAFFETSALQNVRVDEAFTSVTRAVVRVVTAAEDAACGRKPARDGGGTSGGGGDSGSKKGSSGTVKLDDIASPSTASSGCAC